MKKLPGKIVLVDDQEYEEVLLKEALLEKEWDTAIAYFSMASAALKYLKETEDEIFLIISDINMPTMDGYKLLEHVKGDPALKQHPFILLTSEDNNDKKKKAKEVGLDAWVTKPYKIDSFMALIKYNITKSKKNGAV